MTLPVQIPLSSALAIRIGSIQALPSSLDSVHLPMFEMG